MVVQFDLEKVAEILERMGRSLSIKTFKGSRPEICHGVELEMQVLDTAGHVEKFKRSILPSCGLSFVNKTSLEG